jgi:hypothetical protein
VSSDHKELFCDACYALGDVFRGQFFVCVTLLVFGKANWFDHVLHNSCISKHVIEGMAEGKIEGAERRGK